MRSHIYISVCLMACFYNKRKLLQTLSPLWDLTHGIFKSSMLSQHLKNNFIFYFTIRAGKILTYQINGCRHSSKNK